MTFDDVLAALMGYDGREVSVAVYAPGGFVTDWPAGDIVCSVSGRLLPGAGELNDDDEWLFSLDSREAEFCVRRSAFVDALRNEAEAHGGIWIDFASHVLTVEWTA